MKSILQQARTPGLNYRAMYYERTRRKKKIEYTERNLVSVPPTSDALGHTFKTVGFVLVTLAISTGITTLGEMGLTALGMGEGTLTNILAALPAGIFLVWAFAVISPRLGMFPGIFGNSMRLANSENDMALGALIEKNPERFNVDWYRQWAEGTKIEQEKMLKTLRSSLKEAKKESHRAKSADKETVSED